MVFSVVCDKEESAIQLALGSVYPMLLLSGTSRNTLCTSCKQGARCSSVVRAFAHGAMDHRIDPSWWTHWAISHSSQCPTTGVTMAVICIILSVGWCI